MPEASLNHEAKDEADLLLISKISNTHSTPTTFLLVIAAPLAKIHN
jgi:hypothetical protein